MIKDIIKAGVLIGEALNKLLDTLPNYEQRKIKQLQKLEIAYQEEVRSATSDSDYLVTLRYRRQLLLEHIVKTILAHRKG